MAFFFWFVQRKTLFFRILLLILLSSIFAGFGEVFDGGQVGEISFYVVYLLLFAMLMDSFSALCVSLYENLSWLSRFMKVLSPAYFLAVAASSGGTTAAVFYEGVLLLVWLIQWILLTVLLPGIHICTVVRFVNNLSREEMLGKLSELFGDRHKLGIKNASRPCDRASGCKKSGGTCDGFFKKKRGWKDGRRYSGSGKCGKCSDGAYCNRRCSCEEQSWNRGNACTSFGRGGTGDSLWNVISFI